MDAFMWSCFANILVKPNLFIYLFFRTSPSEFIIPLSKYRKAVHFTQVSVGMRFRMVFETDESTLRRYRCISKWHPCPFFCLDRNFLTLYHSYPLCHSYYLISFHLTSCNSYELMFIHICKQIYGNCNWNWRFRSKPLAWIKMAQSRGMQRVGWFMENVNILANIFFSGCFRCPNMVIRLDGMSPVLVNGHVEYPLGRLNLYLSPFSFALLHSLSGQSVHINKVLGSFSPNYTKINLINMIN